jgi:Mg2+ and Co2+ transporter CorA
MVTAYLFDKRHGEEVESCADSVRNLSKDQVLWLDVEDPSQEEEAEVRAALGVSDASRSRLSDPDASPTLDQQESYLRVTAVAVSDEESDPDPETIVVDCFVGLNWVLTAHDNKLAVIDDFRVRSRT